MEKSSAKKCSKGSYFWVWSKPGGFWFYGRVVWETYEWGNDWRINRRSRQCI